MHWRTVCACAGVAVGLDRVLMLELELSSLDPELLAFAADGH